MARWRGSHPDVARVACGLIQSSRYSRLTHPQLRDDGFYASHTEVYHRVVWLLCNEL